jgi:MFS family permease
LSETTGDELSDESGKIEGSRRHSGHGCAVRSEERGRRAVNHGAPLARGVTRRTILIVAVIAFAAGYGQFGAVSALGEVARAFGHPVAGSSIAAEAGMSGTVLGAGLGVLRLASLVGLPLAALADRWGRSTTMAWWCILGLMATMAAAASPSYWWFVVLFALGRPFLSATSALAQVVTAELSRPDRRAGALAVVSAGYGLGAGINALVHAALRGTLGFRGLFLTAVIPLFVVVVVKRFVPEPARIPEIEASSRPRFAWVAPSDTTRLLRVMSILFIAGLVATPASSFVFLFAEDVVKLGKGAESGMIIAAALTGLLGLLTGRWVADAKGRRPAITAGLLGLAFSSILLYSGGRVAVVLGYQAVVFSSGFLAPAGTAFPNELFATVVRASVAGWGIVASVLGAVAGLLVFGTVVTTTNSFVGAAAGTAASVLVALVLLRGLPETRGEVLIGTIGDEEIT